MIAFLKRFNLQESRGGVSYFKEECGVFSKNNILREVWLIMSDYIFSRGGDVGVCASRN